MLMSSGRTRLSVLIHVGGIEADTWFARFRTFVEEVSARVWTSSVAGTAPNFHTLALTAGNRTNRRWPRAGSTSPGWAEGLVLLAGDSYRAAGSGWRIRIATITTSSASTSKMAAAVNEVAIPCTSTCLACCAAVAPGSR